MIAVAVAIAADDAAALRALERNVIRPEERRWTRRIPQFRMQHGPPEEFLEAPTTILDEFGRETTDRLLLRQMRHDGAGSLDV
jgi:hypothetical protein